MVGSVRIGIITDISPYTLALYDYRLVDDIVHGIERRNNKGNNAGSDENRRDYIFPIHRYQNRGHQKKGKDQDQTHEGMTAYFTELEISEKRIIDQSSGRREG